MLSTFVGDNGLINHNAWIILLKLCWLMPVWFWFGILIKLGKGTAQELWWCIFGWSWIKKCLEQNLKATFHRTSRIIVTCPDDVSSCLKFFKIIWHARNKLVSNYVSALLLFIQITIENISWLVLSLHSEGGCQELEWDSNSHVMPCDREISGWSVVTLAPHDHKPEKIWSYC